MPTIKSFVSAFDHDPLDELIDREIAQSDELILSNINEKKSTSPERATAMYREWEEVKSNVVWKSLAREAIESYRSELAKGSPKTKARAALMLRLGEWRTKRLWSVLMFSLQNSQQAINDRLCDHTKELVEELSNLSHRNVELIETNARMSRNIKQLIQRLVEAGIDYDLDFGSDPGLPLTSPIDDPQGTDG